MQYANFPRTISSTTNLIEYMEGLDIGWNFLKVDSENPENPTVNGSCFMIVGVINKSKDIAILCFSFYDTTKIYLRKRSESTGWQNWNSIG